MNHPSSRHGRGSGGPDVVVDFIVVDVVDAVTVVDEDVDAAVVEVLEVDLVVDDEDVELVLVVVDDVVEAVVVDVVDDKVTGSLHGRQFSASSLSISPGPDTQH